jgi:hypothetical protein
MRIYFVFAAIFVVMSVALTFVSPRPAGAFIANADGVAKAATRTDTIEVKHKTPPGWHHGRKTGWHGRGKPPGHQP